MRHCFIQRSYFLSSFYFTFQLHYFLTFYFLATFPKTSSVSKSSHSFTLKGGLDSRFTRSCFAFFKFSHSFTLRCGLDSRFARSCFAFSLLFFLAAIFDFSAIPVGPMHYLQDPQTSLFNNFFIKNSPYGTIHTFKNYFVTMFSVFSFQFSIFNFQQNKLYLNGS